MKKMMIVLPLLIGIGSISLDSMASARANGQDAILTIYLGNLMDMTSEEIETGIDGPMQDFFESVSAELNCSVTVKGKVTVGVAAVEIIVEVSGPCSEIKSQGTAIANHVLSEVKNALSKK